MKTISLENLKKYAVAILVSMVKPKKYTIEPDTPRASWLQRTFCVILDFALIFLITASITSFVYGSNTEEYSNLIILIPLYRPIAQILFHQTLAEQSLHLYVANEQGTHLNLLQIVKKHFFLTSFLLGLFFAENILLGRFCCMRAWIWGLCALIWILSSFRAFKSDRRTLLDLFSGSYVYKNINGGEHGQKTN